MRAALALALAFVLCVAVPARGGRAAGDDGIARAATAYRASLETLRALLEGEVERAERTASAERGLFAEGAATRAELDSAERALAVARARAESVRAEIEEAESLVAEASAPADTAPAPTDRAPSAFGSRAGSWSMADVGAVRSFFAATFGRPLPVSAFGQTALHTRLGYDHSNAVDVPVHPDSAEGRALVAYLRGAGIPFLAFRGPIPGVATGAHIHIGRPSHRLSRE